MLYYWHLLRNKDQEKQALTYQHLQLQIEEERLPQQTSQDIEYHTIICILGEE